MTSVSIVIPAFNEAATILEILRRVRAQMIPGYDFQVIVIDDGSKDGMGDLLMQHPNLYDRLISRPKNGGKGAAIIDGLEAATSEYVLFQDADLEYDPADYKKILEPVTRFQADIVMGSRLVASPITRVSYFWNRLGNRLITLTFNILNNMTFTDIYTCYFLYKRSLVDPSSLKTVGWEQQAEILSYAVARARAIYEVPINYYGRTYEEGKKIRARHIIAILSTILVARLRKSRMAV